MLSEQLNGSIIEIKSYEVNFLQDDILSRGALNRSLNLLEAIKPKENTMISHIEEGKKFLILYICASLNYLDTF